MKEQRVLVCPRELKVVLILLIKFYNMYTLENALKFYYTITFQPY